MSKRKIISAIIICLLIPALVICGYFLTSGGHYYLVSVIIIAVSMLPFFLSLERKRLKSGELVITAAVIAIAVASRAAFFFLPNIKPMCGILTAVAVSFGAEFGFVSGALSVLLSNFIYGQGMWTPFQMLGMGLTVFVSSVIIRAFRIKNRFVSGIVSGLSCFILYGLVVDLSSVFMMLSEYNLKSVSAIYLSGMPFNAIHGLTTAVVVALIQPSIIRKLERIKTKYGLFCEK